MNLREHAHRTPGTDARSRAPMPPVRVVQRKCGCGGTCGGCGDKKKKVQRRALGDTSPEIPVEVESVLRASGAPLDADTRTTMESRFGRSFADVRVHTDAHAAASARAIDAAAYTAGTHIVFGAGRFDPLTTTGRRLLAHELAHVLQQRNGTALAHGVGPADDVHEREADRVADAVVTQGPVFTPPPVIAPTTRRLIRRQVDEESVPDRQPLIVEDSATPGAGQMQRSEFVEQLDAAICATADAEMARLGQSTTGCPLLAQWRPRIRAMDARTLETSIRRWADDTGGVRTAHDYIPGVTRRLARSIALWGATGRIIGVPPDLMDLLGGSGPIRLGVGSLLRGAIGGLFRKGRDGWAAPAGGAVLLERGRTLDTGIAARMGSAFGRDFSHVRIHTGREAAGAASHMNARAFTVGEQIAFADGEYRPGTIVGDALLAHELAHVAQQDGATELAAKSGSANGALENDADDAAVHAVASLWPSVRRYARGLRANAMPRLKSSLQLQRCASTSLPAIAVDPRRGGGFSQTADAPPAGCAPAERGATRPGTIGQSVSCCTPAMIAEIRAVHPEALARVRHAIDVLQPPRVGAFNDQLQRHFGVGAQSEHVATIRSNFERILAQMDGSTVQFDCRSNVSDVYCRRSYARTDSCHAGVPPVIQICGDYEASTAGSGAFLYARTDQAPSGGQHRGWVRTLIHEYAHTFCLDAARGGGPAMLTGGAGSEVYRSAGTGYPPPVATALRNPDSYAWFAMDVSRLA